jgi:protein-S-isoprenylcysteine O-methyltransferase Ste14
MASPSTASRTIQLQLLVLENVPPLSAWKRLRNLLVCWRQPILIVCIAVVVTRLVFFSHSLGLLFGANAVFTFAGLVLLLSGLAWRSWGAGIVRKNRQVANRGPFALCRHPLYLGSIQVMAGCCLLVGDAAVAVAFGMPFLLIHVLRIWREEEWLRERFGEEYVRYAAAVPCLIPLPRRTSLRAEWSVALWRKNREARTILYVVTGMAALLLWQYVF